MATAEPTRADDAEPGPGSGPRIRLPATDGDGHPDHADGDAPRPTGPLAFAEPLRQRLLRHPALSVTVLAGVLHIIWFFTFANSGGDLAAQDAWAEFVGRHPDSACLPA
ncbi:MFS transporter, partial [Streptomyces sp. NPDC000405]